MKSLGTFMTILVVIMVMIAGFLFTMNNDQPAALWLGTDLSARPLGVWVLGAFISGGFTGLLLGAGFLRRLYGKMRAQQVQTRLLQKEKEIEVLKQQLRGLQHKQISIRDRQS